MKSKHLIKTVIPVILICSLAFCSVFSSFAAPEMSADCVSLYKNNIEVASFSDIDSAFAAITDAVGEYVILLKNTDAEYALSCEKTPDAVSIVIRTEEQIAKTVNILSETFTVTSTLEFVNVNVQFKKMDIGASAIAFNRVSRAKGNELVGESSSTVILNYSTLNIASVDVGTVTSLGFSFSEGDFYADKVKGTVSFGVPLGTDKRYKVKINSFG